MDDSPPAMNLRPRRPIHKPSPRHHGSSSSLNDTTDKSETVETESESEEKDLSKISRGDLNSSAISDKRTPSKGGRTGRNKKDTPTTPKSISCEMTEKESIKDNKPKAGTNKFSVCLRYTLMLVIFVSLILAITNIQSIPNPVINTQTLQERFNDEMNDIKSRFPAQSSRFWKIVKISLRKIVKEAYPDYPAVLLLVVPSGSKASETGTCIAKHLTKTINTLFNVTSERVINIVNDIGHKDSDFEKKELDRKIRYSFENEHLRSVAVDHFEVLTPRASLLFHGYCDGDNAPFKNVAIVFILHTDIDRETLKNDPTLIDKHLIELWSSTEYRLDRDKIDPLIARVANNAVVVEEEKNLKCN